MENYGDLLFPLVAARRLGGMGVDVLAVSPVGGPPVWADCVTTVSPEALAEVELDGSLVGGGNIVHAGRAGVDAYRYDGLTALLAYARCWSGASEIGAHRNVPVCWNAPGVPRAFTPAGAKLLSWAIDQVGYLSVRDLPSARALGLSGIERPATVVPDTALDAPDLWTASELDEAHAELFSQRGRAIPDRTLAIHLNRRYVAGSAEAIGARLDRLGEIAAATPVLVATGPCHGDGQLAATIAARMESEPLVLDRPTSLREVAAAIARAEAYVGSSLHGAITAVAFGQPAMIVGTEEAAGGKFSGFLDGCQLGEWLVPDWATAETRLEALLSAPRGLFERVRPAAAETLDRHWERIGTELTRSRPAGTGADTSPPSMDRLISEGVLRLVSDLADVQKHVASERARAEEAEGEAEHERGQFQKQIEAMQDRYDEAALALTEERERGHQLRAEVERHEADLQRALDTAGTEAADTERRLATLEENLATANRQLSEAESLCEKLAANERTEAAAKDELRRSLTDERARTEALEQQVAAVRSESAERAEAARAARESAESLSDQLEALGSRLAEAEATADTVPGLKAELERLGGRLAAAETAAGTVPGLKAELETLGSRLAQAEASAAAVPPLETELETLRRRVSDRDEMVRQLTAAAERLRAGQARFEDELEQARADGEAASAALAQLDSTRQSLSTVRERYTAATLELETAQASLAGSEHRVGQLVAGVRELQSLAERTAASRSWRYGHAAFRTLGALTGRKPVGDGALAKMKTVSTRLLRAGGDHLPPPTGGRPEAVPAAEAADSDVVVEQLTALGSGRRPSNGHDPLLDRLPTDVRGLIRGPGADDPGILDVVVCVRDAYADTFRALHRLVTRSTHPYGLILVDDGSSEPTARLLRAVRERYPGTVLIRRHGPTHGYTLAANEGLRASTASNVVLLNSDTEVATGWAERLIDTAQSDPAIGLVGPFSNAATHQSLPEVKRDGRWAVNEHPPWLSTEVAATAVAQASTRQRPRVPFLNGFCLLVKREVIERVGLFDEVAFAEGYGEENDYCMRAAAAGFELAVADDGYVWHSKSRSYTMAERERLAVTARERLTTKHGKAAVDKAVSALEDDDDLARARSAAGAPLRSSEETASALFSVLGEPLRATYLLPGVAEGGSGGAHSVVQEALALRDLGATTRVVIGRDHMQRAKKVYGRAARVFTPYESSDELATILTDSHVAIATHHTTASELRNCLEGHGGVLAAYYIQDYEPLFYPKGSERWDEARASYEAMQDALCFAKSEWLCELVRRTHQMPVHRVIPSVDGGTYRPRRRGRRDRRFTVTAMLRPRTPRRRAHATLAALEELGQAMGSEVRIQTFGCDPDFDREARKRSRAKWVSLGVLQRSEVADALARSDVFVDASSYQAFGRTALEAMACGCVSVVPDLGGVTEFTRDGVNARIVDTSTPSAIVEAVVDVRERLEPMRTAAIKATAGLSVEAAALSQLALFVTAVADRRPVGSAAST